MGIVISFIIGAIIGGGVMFFVCRNNAKGFAEKEAALRDEIDGLKAKANAVKDVVKG